MKELFNVVSISIFLTFFSWGVLTASQQVHVQLAVATPDPVQAGESATFKIIYVNNSADLWKAKDYSAFVEIFNDEGKFIKRVKPSVLENNVKPGDSTLFMLTEKIPDDFAGNHLFRVGLLSKGRSIHISDFNAFYISAADPPGIEPAEDPEPVTVFRGNAVLSNRLNWKTSAATSAATSRGYNSNLSLNLMGGFSFGSLVFNSTVYTTDEDMLDIYNINLNISGSQSTLELGDSMPNFSDLSLRNQSGRGINYNHRVGSYDFKVAALQTAESEEGEDNFAGSYARYVLGASGSRTVSEDLDIGISAVRAFDDRKSISKESRMTPAETSNILSAFVNYRPGKFTLSAETGVNIFETQNEEDGSRTSATSTAARGSVKYSRSSIQASALFYITEPSFITLGAPGISNDRIGYEGSLRYNFLPWLNFGYTRRTHNDNIESLPADEKTTTLQNSDNISMTIGQPGIPSIQLSGTINTVESDPEGSLENESVSGSASLSHSFSGHFLSGGMSISQFKDKTGSSSDLSTLNTSISYSGAVSRRLTLSGGYSENRTKYVDGDPDRKSGRLRSGATFRIIPGALNLAMSASLTERSSDSKTAPLDTVETKASLETTWRLHENYTATIGGSFTWFKDRNDSDENEDSFDLLVRWLYSF